MILCVDNSLKGKVLDMRMVRGSGLSDHFVVLSKIWMRGKWQRREREWIGEQVIRVEKLDESEKRGRYESLVRERLESCEAEVMSGSEEIWGALKGVVCVRMFVELGRKEGE